MHILTALSDILNAHFLEANEVNDRQANDMRAHSLTEYNAAISETLFYLANVQC